MGKTAKKRKRLAAAEQLRVASLPVAPADGVDDSPFGCVAPADMATTLRTLEALATLPPTTLKTSKPFRGFRKALHPLMAVLGAATAKPASPSAQVASALADGRWDDAVAALKRMKATGDSLKLGALQRAVHACALDTIHAYDPVALRVLDAIIRVSDPTETTSSAAGAGSWRPPPAVLPPPTRPGGGGRVIQHPAWSAVEKPRTVLGASMPPPGKDAFKVVAHEAAAERRPPNKFPLDIYASVEAAVKLEGDPGVTRVDVPSIPGVFCMMNVLTPEECLSVIAAAEAVGYQPDQPLNRPTGSSVPQRAATVAWLADTTMMDALFRRCLPHLPPVMDGGPLAGLNARLRLYKYSAGNVYGPHIDGAWPGSGLVDGAYTWDAFGDRWSRLTFLLYLNDDFEGGSTTFFSPDAAEGVLHARSVAPRAGCVLCFPHGDATGALVHEGSLVTSGFKYIVRTDVLYHVDTRDCAKLFSRHVEANKQQDAMRKVATGK